QVRRSELDRIRRGAGGYRIPARLTPVDILPASRLFPCIVLFHGTVPGEHRRDASEAVPIARARILTSCNYPAPGTELPAEAFWLPGAFRLWRLSCVGVRGCRPRLCIHLFPVLTARDVMDLQIPRILRCDPSRLAPCARRPGPADRHDDRGAQP